MSAVIGMMLVDNLEYAYDLLWVACLLILLKEREKTS